MSPGVWELLLSPASVHMNVIPDSDTKVAPSWELYHLYSVLKDRFIQVPGGSGEIYCGFMPIASLLPQRWSKSGLGAIYSLAAFI